MAYHDNVILWQPSLVGAPCKKIQVFDDEVRSLKDRLYQAMVNYRGVGIAAPQLGMFVSAVIMHPPNGAVKFMANPEILESSGEQRGYEGCLSLPGCDRSGKKIYNRAHVTRAMAIKVHYIDVDGEPREEELRGVDARVAQHEVDHLSGKFFIEHAGYIEQMMVMKKFKFFQQCYARPIPDPALA